MSTSAELSTSAEPGTSAERATVIVKPNAKKDGLLSFDRATKTYRISLKAQAKDNKANIALVRFFSRVLKKRARIISGLKSREKVVKLE